MKFGILLIENNISRTFLDIFISANYKFPYNIDNKKQELVQWTRTNIFIEDNLY